MNLAIVAANKRTVNIFRNMIGLPEAKWEEKEMGIQKQEEQYPTHESKQRTLSEFMSFVYVKPRELMVTSLLI
jgi:hypothetical protein